MNKYILLLALFFSLHQIGADTFSVMTMNVENLFDTKDDYGKDDKAFLPLSEKSSQNHINSCQRIRVNKWKNECLFLDWNDEAKNAKLQNIVKTITLYDDVGPDIIFFQEVENKNILKQLFLLLSTYGYVDFDLIEGNDYRGIDNAVISKYPIINSKLHYIKFSGKYSNKDTRPILNALINIKNKNIRFYGVHFPAPYHNYQMREQAFVSLNKLLENYKEPSIALGDFNVTSEEAIQKRMYINHESLWDIAHHNVCNECFGTYYYPPDNNWSFLDSILVSKKRNLSLIKDSVILVKTPINMDKNNYKPISFSTDNYRGVSDHIPLVAKIKISDL